MQFCHILLVKTNVNNINSRKGLVCRLWHKLDRANVETIYCLIQIFICHGSHITLVLLFIGARSTSCVLKKMCLNSSTSQDFDWCRLMWLQTVRLTSHSKEILEIIPAFNFLFALLLYASQGLAFKCAHAHLCVQHIQYILYMLLRHFAIKKKLGKKRKKEEVALHNLLKKKKKTYGGKLSNRKALWNSKTLFLWGKVKVKYVF